MTVRLVSACWPLVPMLLLAGAGATADAVPGLAPQDLIEMTSRRMLNALDADRAAAVHDPARVGTARAGQALA